MAYCHVVKGRLAKNIKFWEKIGANNFALETLKKGYVIPFLENPVKMFKKNNRSAMKNVSKAKLLAPIFSQNLIFLANRYVQRPRPLDHIRSI